MRRFLWPGSDREVIAAAPALIVESYHISCFDGRSFRGSCHFCRCESARFYDSQAVTRHRTSNGRCFVGRNDKHRDEESAEQGKLKDKDYQRELEKLHVELVALQEWIKHKGLKVCVVFEGRDGAGKGGTI